MSTNYSAWLVIGMPFTELGMSPEEIEETGLEIFWPNQNTKNENCVVGIGLFATPDFGFVDLPEKYRFDESISIAFAKFLTLTGNVGKFYLTMKSI